jgi:hypothetical protein
MDPPAPEDTGQKSGPYFLQKSGVTSQNGCLLILGYIKLNEAYLATARIKYPLNLNTNTLWTLF